MPAFTPTRISRLAGIGVLCAAFAAAAQDNAPNNAQTTLSVTVNGNPKLWHLDPSHSFGINLGPLLDEPARGMGCSAAILESFSMDPGNGTHSQAVREFVDGHSIMPVPTGPALVPGAQVGIYNLDLGTHTTALNDYDIVNMSFQGKDPYAGFEHVQGMIRSLSHSGRGGLGTLFFSAAGNKNDGAPYYEGDKTMAENMTIGAIDKTGSRASYSPRASHIFMMAPGDGVSASGQQVLNGTSFAAPIASGVGCLIKQANPDLGYRDIQDILALTARRYAVNQAQFRMNGARRWNGTGYAYDSRNGYGFGLIDAYAAVRLAESWPVDIPASSRNLKRNTHPPSSRPLSNRSGPRTHQFQFFSSQDRMVEHISIRFSNMQFRPVDTQHGANRISIRLISPAGTEVSMFNPTPDAHKSKGVDYLFTLTTGTHYFRGEPLSGTWTIRIDAPGEYPLSIQNWAVTATSRELPRSAHYIYTHDFSRGYGPGAISGPLMIPGTLNAAAVASNTVLRLDGAGMSQIAGRALRIGANIITTAITGDGDDHIVGPRRGAKITGSRGDDRIETRGGTNDILYRPGIDGHDTIITGGQSRDRLILNYRGDLIQPRATWDGPDLRIQFGSGIQGSVTLKEWRNDKGVQTIFHSHAGTSIPVQDILPRHARPVERIWDRLFRR